METTLHYPFFFNVISGFQGAGELNFPKTQVGAARCPDAPHCLKGKHMSRKSLWLCLILAVVAAGLSLQPVTKAQKQKQQKYAA